MAWSFRKRSGACVQCDHALEDGERHASRLMLREDELVREDLCSACWGDREGEEGELFWWFTTHLVDTSKKSLKLDIEALEGLFVALEKQESRMAQELRYLLCLLLMRKRRLKMIKVRRGGEGEALILRRPRREEEIAVLVFDFDSKRIDALRKKLQDVFEGIESDAGLENLSIEEPEQADETEQADGTEPADGAEQADGHEQAEQPDDAEGGQDDSLAKVAE